MFHQNYKISFKIYYHLFFWSSRLIGRSRCHER